MARVGPRHGLPGHLADPGPAGEDNLYLAAPPDQRPPFWKRKKWGRRLLAEFDLDLELFPDAPARFLTLAERQLFEVAKALVSNPKVLLLDEPTTALGPDEVEALHPHRRRLPTARSGGGLCQPSSPRGPGDRRPDHRPARRKAQGTFDARETSEHALVDLIVGRPFKRRSPHRRQPPASVVVLVVDGLQGQSFGPVSFTLESGEVVGIAGAEGSGQSQLFDCLAGDAAPGREGGVRRPRAQLDLDPPGGAVGRHAPTGRSQA